jgi:hypothetical protein
VTPPVYTFVDRWRVRGTLAQINDIMGDPTDLPRWWGAVYRDARVLEPGDAQGVGKRVVFQARGALPYYLRFDLTVTENRFPHGISYTTVGDFLGRGRWESTQEGDEVALVHTWHVTVHKPVVRWLSPLLRPLFAWNHRWAMRRGLEGLQAELRNRILSAPWRSPLPPLSA